MGPQYPIPASPNLVGDKQAISKLDPQVAEVVPLSLWASLVHTCSSHFVIGLMTLRDAFLDVQMRIPRVSGVRPERASGTQSVRVRSVAAPD